MATDPLVRFRSVYELIEQRLGVKVDFRFGDVTQVGVANVVAARNDPGRAALIMINLSANDIFVRPVDPATTAQGVTLAPGGGSVSMNWQDDLILPALEWNAIAAGANSDFFVIEAIIT